MTEEDDPHAPVTIAFATRHRCRSCLVEWAVTGSSQFLFDAACFRCNRLSIEYTADNLTHKFVDVLCTARGGFGLGFGSVQAQMVVADARGTIIRVNRRTRGAVS
jgi:hypothetical protein